MGGVLLVLAYIGMVAKLKTVPELAMAIELIVAALGASGGLRICWNVLSGKVSALYAQQVRPPSEEDIGCFLIGGFALLWISLEAIVRRFWILYRKTHPNPAGKTT